MLKRLFGIGKKAEPTPSPTPSAARRVSQLYDKPTIPYENYFNVHFYRTSQADVMAQVRDHYLHHVPAGTEAAIMVQDGDWTTLYFPEVVVKGLGFNRISGQIAQALDTWVIGYRIFAWQGMDVHYFNGATHVEQLAYARNDIEFEPENATLFADIADVSDILPRKADQHPLDFHFALLEALGVQNAAVPWDQAKALYGVIVKA
jgi:hypothetical protein